MGKGDCRRASASLPTHRCVMMICEGVPECGWAYRRLPRPAACRGGRHKQDKSAGGNNGAATEPEGWVLTGRRPGEPIRCRRRHKTGGSAIRAARPVQMIGNRARQSRREWQCRRCSENISACCFRPSPSVQYFRSGSHRRRRPATECHRGPDPSCARPTEGAAAPRAVDGPADRPGQDGGRG